MIVTHTLKSVNTLWYYLIGGATVKQESLTMTVEEAAAALNISRSLAYEATRDGRIPAIRIGRRLLVSRHALEKLLEVPKPLNLTPASK
jgi:excisionase family DNA binding protein